MDLYSQTDIGLVRGSNQDDCACGHFSANAVWAVICDGMGGAQGGNIASQMTVSSIKDQISSAYQDSMNHNAIKYLLKTALYNANSAVYEKAQQEDSLRGMGTTVIATVVVDSIAHMIHAGDSRAYLLTERGIRQVTEDHSVVQELINTGDLTKEEARISPHKNIITRAVGVHSTIEADYYEEFLPPGAILLLCTDGLTNYVEDTQIFALSRQYPAEQLPDALVRKAKEGGGGDNITVIVIKMDH